jgi:hypothetical protein
MSDPIRIQPHDGPQRAGASRPVEATRPVRADGREDVAFRALLDRLQQHVERLASDSRTVERPADLAQAVDRAHASLTDALTLGERLLEAYRASLAAEKAARGGG